MKDFKIVLVFIFIINQSFGQNDLENYIDKWSQHKVTKHANVGVAVHDIASGNKIAGYRDEFSLVPASSLKILITLISLEEIGSDYRYKTLIAHDGKIDRDGTLQGNLYIVGSGDPTLGSDRIKGNSSYRELLALIYQKIKEKGITCIDGDIIADESIFDAYPIAPSWQWNDLGNYYAGGAWGLNVNENEYAIYFNSYFKVGSLSKLLYTDPTIPDLILENEVTVDSANTGDNAYVFGGPYDFKKRIVGTIPQSKNKFRIKGSIPDPPLFLARAVRSYLDDKGIKSSSVKVKIKRWDKNKHTAIIGELTSPPLDEITKYANYFSINQYCESLLKTLGNIEKGKGSGGHGIRAVYEYLQKHRIDATALHLEDGSGLSARNLVSPEVLSHFLADYAERNGVEVVQSMLPKAGADGTVRSLLGGTSARGNVWVKSGSMERVLSYTGICKARSGKWVSFSIIINGYTGEYKDIKPRAEQIINQIYKMN